MAHIVLTPDIPWNPEAVHRQMHSAAIVFDNLDRCREVDAAWGIILCCDRMEELGFFNLAQGREPNARA
jgi:hypothetical protein